MEINSTPPLKNYPTIPQSIGLLFMLLVFSIVGAFIVSSFLSFQSSLGITLIYSLGLGLTILFALRLRHNKTLAWNEAFPPKILVIGLLMIIPFHIGLDPLREMLPEAEGFNSLSRNLLETPITTLVLFVLAAPVLEEILFRGIILDGYLTHYNRWTAISISALFFALVHGNWQQGVGALGMGLYFGWVYLKTNSLYAVIILHAANNFVAAISAFSIPKKYQSNSLAEIIAEQNLYWLLVIVSLVLVIIGVYYSQKAFPKIESLTASDESHLDTVP